MKRTRRPDPVLITDAAESPEAQMRRREIRYLVMMSTRALCLVLAVALVLIRPPLLGLWLVLCVIGMVLLPWLAVIIANDRPPKSRAERRRQWSEPSNQPALPPAPDDRTIDQD